MASISHTCCLKKKSPYNVSGECKWYTAGVLPRGGMLSARRWECLNLSYWEENKTSTQSNPFLKTGPSTRVSALVITAKPWLGITVWLPQDCPYPVRGWLLGTRSGNPEVIAGQPGNFHLGQKLAIWDDSGLRDPVCFLSVLCVGSAQSSDSVKSRWPSTKINPSTNLPLSQIILPGWPKAGGWKRFPVHLRARTERLGTKLGDQSQRVTWAQFAEVALSWAEFSKRKQGGSRPGMLLWNTSGEGAW